MRLLIICAAMATTTFWSFAAGASSNTLSGSSSAINYNERKSNPISVQTLALDYALKRAITNLSSVTDGSATSVWSTDDYAAAYYAHVSALVQKLKKRLDENQGDATKFRTLHSTLSRLTCLSDREMQSISGSRNWALAFVELRNQLYTNGSLVDLAAPSKGD